MSFLSNARDKAIEMSERLPTLRYIGWDFVYDKDKEWIVFYLNRWICGAFSLPLSYGGWRKRTFSELEDWIKKDEKWEILARLTPHPQPGTELWSS